MKAQIAIEYMMLLGIFFLFLITVFYFVSTESVTTVQNIKAVNVVNSLANTADYIFTLGPGSQDTIEIDMPGNVKSISILDKEILMKIGISGGDTDIFVETKANITGTISTERGIKHIKLKVLDNGVVQIGA